MEKKTRGSFVFVFAIISDVLLWFQINVMLAVGLKVCYFKRETVPSMRQVPYAVRAAKHVFVCLFCTIFQKLIRRLNSRPRFLFY